MAKDIEDAVKWACASKIKSLAAGKMGYCTSEVGDLIAEKAVPLDVVPCIYPLKREVAR